MIEIPDWLAKLPKNARLNLDEFSKALGISRELLTSRRSKGHMDTPPEDGFCNRNYGPNHGVPANGVKKRRKPTWKAVTVRNYIRHLNRLELDKNK